jgi:hypothetical protein
MLESQDPDHQRGHFAKTYIVILVGLTQRSIDTTPSVTHDQVSNGSHGHQGAQTLTTLCNLRNWLGNPLQKSMLAFNGGWNESCDLQNGCERINYQFKIT